MRGLFYAIPAGLKPALDEWLRERGLTIHSGSQDNIEGETLFVVVGPGDIVNIPHYVKKN